MGLVATAYVTILDCGPLDSEHGLQDAPIVVRMHRPYGMEGFAMASLGSTVKRQRLLAMAENVLSSLSCCH